MSHSEYSEWLVDKAVAKATLRILELENTVEELSKEMGEVKRHLEDNLPRDYGLNWEHGRERDDD